MGSITLLGTGKPAAAAAGTATFNPSDKAASLTLSNGDLTATSGAANQGVRTIASHSTGKYGFTWSDLTGTSKIGICLSTDSLTADIATGAGAYALYVVGSQVYHNGSTAGMPSPDGAAGATGTWALDFDANLAWFLNTTTGKWNNSVDGSANPATGVGGFTIDAGTYYAVFGGDNTDAATVNLSSPSLPSGWTAWG